MHVVVCKARQNAGLWAGRSRRIRVATETARSTSFFHSEALGGTEPDGWHPRTSSCSFTVPVRLDISELPPPLYIRSYQLCCDENLRTRCPRFHTAKS